jgi:hypothetical protein
MANKQMECLNTGVLANLTAEELEERLEMQVLRVPEASCEWSCDAVCSSYTCYNVSASGCASVYCQSYCS